MLVKEVLILPLFVGVLLLHTVLVLIVGFLSGRWLLTNLLPCDFDGLALLHVSDIHDVVNPEYHAVQRQVDSE